MSSKKDWDTVLSKLDEIINEIRGKEASDEFTEWWVYESSIQRDIDFNKFLEENSFEWVRDSRYEAQVNKNFKIKFVLLENLTGIAFGANDFVYLKSRITKENTQRILSRMRG